MTGTDFDDASNKELRDYHALSIDPNRCIMDLLRGQPIKNNPYFIAYCFFLCDFPMVARNKLQKREREMERAHLQG